MIEVRQSERFEKWLRALRDRQARVRILDRLLMLEDGHFGDVKNLGNGLSELRFRFGPGYRVYFTRRGDVIILLLCGGDKSSQERDIALARNLIEELK